MEVLKGGGKGVEHRAAVAFLFAVFAANVVGSSGAQGY